MVVCTYVTKLGSYFVCLLAGLLSLIQQAFTLWIHIMMETLVGLTVQRHVVKY